MAIQLNHRQDTITTGATAETAGVTLIINNTGSLTLPKGTDAQKPVGGVDAVAGDFRFNTDQTYLEYFDGSEWVEVLAGNVQDLVADNGQFILDGVDAAGLSPTNNHIQVSNAAGGSNPEIAVVGDDTDAGLDLAAKGAGSINISDGNGTIATFTSGGASSFEFRGGSTAAVISAGGDMILDANILHIQDQGDKVAEFEYVGGDDYLSIKAVTSGVQLEVTGGSAPAELIINQVLTMAGNSIKEVADPSNPQDAATKAYVDAAINGLDWKESVRAATTADISGGTYNNTGGANGAGQITSAPAAIDGVTLVQGDRVLVKDGVAGSNVGNGIYVVTATTTTWDRADDADNQPGNEVSSGLAAFVEEGSTNADTAWTITSPEGDTVLGTDNIIFTQFAGPGSLTVVGGDGISTSQNGNDWTVTADVDGVTIRNDGGTGAQLAVQSSNTAGEVLVSDGAAGDATWGALDLANTDAVTGVLPEGNGGTGESTYAQGDILVATATDDLGKLALGTDGQFLKSDGVDLVYASASLQDLDGFDVTGAVAGEALVFDGTNWTNGSIDLSSEDAVEGTLDVTKGGTGLTSVGQGSLVYGTGDSALATLPIGTSSSSELGFVLKTKEDGTAPEWGSLGVGQLSDVSALSPNSGDVLVFDGDDWVPQAGADTDKFVRVTTNDTTSGFLDDKIVVQGALSANVLNGSGDEDLQLSVKVDDTTIFENSNELAVKSSDTAGQVLVSDGAEGVATWGALDLANEEAITGVLDTQAGGTGLSSVADQSLLLGAGTSALSELTVGGNGTFLRVSAGSVLWDNMVLADISDLNLGTAVSGNTLVFDGNEWVAGALDLAADDAVTGVLPVEHGGTGAASVTAGSLLLGDGTNALTELAPGTASTSALATVLVTDESGDIAFGNLKLDQLADVSVDAAADNNVLQYNATSGDWEPTALADLDKLVRITASDTTSGFLDEKLVGASDGAITTTVANAAADEDLELSVNVDDTTIIKTGNNLAVGDGSNDVSNQALFGAAAGNAASWAYVGNLRDASTGEVIVAAGGTVTNGNNLGINASDGDTTLTSQEDLFIVAASSNNVSIQGTQYPNSVGARSVLVANTASELTTVQASAGDFQILRWNNTGGTFEFVSQDDVGGFSFSDITLAGNTNGVDVSATQTLDTLTVEGGAGIAVDGASKQLTFSQTTDGVTTQAPVLADTIQFFNGGTLVQTDMAAFLSALDVPVVPGGTGFVVQTSAGEFANRSLVASTNDAELGAIVNNGDGSAGDIEVGLDINGLDELVGSADTNADFVVLYDADASKNVKVSVSALVGGIDNTRINDTADTTYVDTDEKADTVIVAAGDGTVAEFVNGTAGSAQFFSFDAGTSAGTLRLVAEGTDTDTDIRIVPAGNGQVFIGDTGDGVIQSDDEFDLTVKGGNTTTANAGGDMLVEGGDSTSSGDGGNTVIRGGSSTGGTAGTTQITDADGNEFVTFGNDSSVKVANVSDASSFTKKYVVTLETTGTGTDSATIALEADSANMVEVTFVARDASNDTWNGSIRVKGVPFMNGGTATLPYTVQEIIDVDPNISGIDATYTVTGGNISLDVTGANASSNLKWTAFVEMTTVVN